MEEGGAQALRPYFESGLTFGVALLGRWASPYPVGAFGERYSCSADPADSSCGGTSHDRKRLNVSRDHRASSHEGPGADGDGGYADRSGTNRGAEVHPDSDRFPILLTLELPAGRDGPWELVVCQNDGRADENAIGQHRWLVDKGIVLHFALVTDTDPGTDVGAAADDAILADDSILADLSQVPDASPGTDRRRVTDVGRVLDLTHLKAPWVPHMAQGGRKTE